MKPRVLILHANGTNRDLDVAQAIETAGGLPEVYHLNQLRNSDVDWKQFQMVVLPGGFSYADALGAGKLMAIDLNSYFCDQAIEFIGIGRPVIGICNGFQALVKAGLLPGRDDVRATLSFNDAGHFECRWVTLAPRSRVCLWTKDLDEPVDCPVAHGEGNFILSRQRDLELLLSADQVALVYVNSNGGPAGGSYPANPNGSIADIAGICNPRGNVLGLMPHPEDHIFAFQHPRWTRNKGKYGRLGLAIFQNGIRYACSS
jgi:phosphoribosylformylglycinamidine synthase